LPGETKTQPAFLIASPDVTIVILHATVLAAPVTSTEVGDVGGDVDKEILFNVKSVVPMSTAHPAAAKTNRKIEAICLMCFLLCIIIYSLVNLAHGTVM
jgi:hypothetical protein